MRNLALLAAYTAIVLFRPGPAFAADAAAVAKIHGGSVDCVACDLTCANLINTFVHEHYTHRAGFAGVAKTHGGIVDCVACDLTGANLMNTCVKEHALHGADFDGADATL